MDGKATDSIVLETPQLVEARPATNQSSRFIFLVVPKNGIRISTVDPFPHGENSVRVDLATKIQVTIIQLGIKLT